MDDNNGNQDCEALERGGKATEADWIKAVIAAHHAMLSGMGRYDDKPEQGKKPEAPKLPGGTLDRKPSP